MNKDKYLKNPIVLFLILITTISFIVYLWMFLKGENNAAVALMMWTPAIAAGLTSLILRVTLSPYGWKPGKWKYWGYAYLLPVFVALVGYGLMWVTGFTEFYTDEVVNYRWARMLGFESPAPFVVGFLSKLILASLLTSVFALGEEIGWSAFLTPRMLEKYSIPKASIILGLIWAIWHYPAIIGGLYGHGAPLWAALPGFTLVLIGASFISTSLIVKSKSFWVGMVVHTSHNVVLMGIFYEMTVKTTLAPYLVSESGLFLGLVYLAIGVLVWKFTQKQI
jgi:membrane protease YdiL (CAAX protease family)